MAALVGQLMESCKTGSQATCARLFYVEGRKTSEIASELKMPHNTVCSHLARFRIALKSALLKNVVQ